METNIYSIFISREDTVIRIPVNPETLPTNQEADNDDYNVLGIGPIMVPRIPKQRVVTISSFFPGRPLTWAPDLWDGFHEPQYYINFFTSAMNEKAVVDYLPVRSYETGEPFAVDLVGFYALVTSFSYEERGGETGDFYYDLELTEYRDYSPKLISLNGQLTPTATSRPIPEGQLYVGAVCVASGKYYASSYGDPPYGTASGQRVVVSRIVDETRAYPYHITTESGGILGWINKSALEVSNNA